MSGSLENRSSLRKLEFPYCSQEALNRLHASLSASALKASPGALATGPAAAAALTLSPKETELVLEIIDEFVFFTKSRSKRLNAVQELQLMQVITDFFQEKSSIAAAAPNPGLAFQHQMSTATLQEDPTQSAYFSQNMVLSNLFNYLFMEPPNASSKSEDKCTERMKSLFKLTSITLGLKNRTILQCLGVWLHRQGPTSERGLQLCEAVLNEFVLLVPEPLEALKNMPVIAPLFAAHFMTSLAEVYSLDLAFKTQATSAKTYSSTIISNPNTKWNNPPKCVIDLLVCWMGEGGEGAGSSEDVASPPRHAPHHHRMLPAMTPFLESAVSSLGTQSGSVPVMGVAKWCVIHPLVFRSNQGGASSKYEEESFAKLHVGILECLADAHQKRHLLRSEIIHAKKVAVFLGEVRVILDNFEEEVGEGGSAAAATQECLDRLGQFLNCLIAAKCVHGKLDEVVNSLRGLSTHNTMISILLNNIAKYM